MVETTSRVGVATALLLAVVAGIDAVRGGHWDQLAMLSAIAALLVIVLVASRLRPASVEVRADVGAWLRDEAARTDDTAERIADRALAIYRSSRAAGDEVS